MAKIRSLHVRPARSSDLCFTMPGVISWQSQSRVRLGERVTGVDVDAGLVTHLGDVVAGGVDAVRGRLARDGEGIRTWFEPHALFTVQNREIQAELDQAMIDRQQAWLTRFQHSPALLAAIRAQHVGPDSKLSRLRDLEHALAERQELLDGAYAADGLAVVRELPSTTTGSGTTTSVTKMRSIRMKNFPHTVHVERQPSAETHSVTESYTTPQQFREGAWEDIQSSTPDFESQSNSSSSVSDQRSTRVILPFSHPRHELRIETRRQQLTTADEVLAAELFAAQVPHLEQIWSSELAKIDLEIRKLQLRFMRTFLTTPISGTIAAIYKDVGESVQPGEPVLRIEDDTEVLLVGFIQHRGLIRIGDRATITTNDAFEDGSDLSITGRVAAIRGHDTDNDEWDVMVAARNEARVANAPAPIRLPPNYHFDRHNTSIDINA